MATHDAVSPALGALGAPNPDNTFREHNARYFLLDFLDYTIRG